MRRTEMGGLLPYKDLFPKVDDSVFIAPGAWVIGDVVIGERSSVWFNTIVRGDVHYIRIGSETNIQDNSTLHVTEGRFPMTIGDRVTIGHRAVVHGCIVEDDCLIGMGAVVMDGAKIGKGSLVAAGSLLTPGFEAPPGSLIMGSPATAKKELGEHERQLMRASVAHYIQLAEDYLRPDGFEHAKKVKGFLG
jgi:carbonic anhydrase/acetyltransferase-like protein (isoleucine patch superfamily)